VKRSTRLPFALPDISDAEIEAVTRVLRSGWLTTGPVTKEFEASFAERIGVRHAIALNSGTAALHLALDAIGLGRMDEVIVPDFTFTATAEVVRYFDAKPVLVDINAEDLTIDVEAAEQAITERTRAVIGVDIGGQPCDWPALRGLAKRHALQLIDDAAHALPSALAGRPIGQWADLTAFSFYATKTITTGEGGMLVTDDPVFAERARTMSLHGIGRDAWKRYSAEGSWYYEVLAPGFKYNMTDIAAAMGLVQLRRLDEMTARRQRIAAMYTEALNDLEEVELPAIRSGSSSCWHLYPLRLNLGLLRCDRASFIGELAAENISTSVHFIPLHLHPYYRQTYGYQHGDFPVSSREYSRIVSLPIYSRMTDDDAQDVTSAVKRAVRRNRHAN
jgi:perosamine synthetase